MNESNTPYKQRLTLAVLPFLNMSSSSENEYFSDGMTEEIINALAKIKELKVTSRTSSFFFKNKNIPIPEIGKQLNVSTILEGSIRLAGNQMRITAQLIDVEEDFHFWSETFDRSMENIFEVQDEVSLLIADKLREHVGHFDVQDHLVDSPGVPVEVYKRYLKSRYHILKMTKTDIDLGLSMIREIIKEQPNYPMAYLGGHLAYTLIGTLGLISTEEAFMRGQPYLEKAMQLDPDLPECHLHQSWVCFLQEWNFPGAYQHLNQLIKKSPIVDAYQSMASVLVAEAKYDAAKNYLEIAAQVDPFSAVNYHLKGFVLYCQERYEEAVLEFDHSIEMNPDFTAPIVYRGMAWSLMGKAKECLDFFQNFPPDKAEGDLLALGGVAMGYSALGMEKEAYNELAKLEAKIDTPLMGRAMNYLIFCNALLGNYEKSIDFIELGVKNRLPMMVYLYIDPLLKSIRSHARFQSLMKVILGEKTAFDPEPKRKYKKALFSAQELEDYRSALDRLMAEEQPYLNPDLSLRDLAKLMDLPANYLSQLLNEGLDKNFSEYINSYRLEAFKTKAAEPSNRHLTILALAYDSGFNSKTVFNTFFKKVMGMTPSKYWKMVVE